MYSVFLLFHKCSDCCRLLIIIIGNLNSCSRTAGMNDLSITNIKCYMIYISVSIEYQITRLDLTYIFPSGSSTLICCQHRGRLYPKFANTDITNPDSLLRLSGLCHHIHKDFPRTVMRNLPVPAAWPHAGPPLLLLPFSSSLPQTAEWLPEPLLSPAQLSLKLSVLSLPLRSSLTCAASSSFRMNS